MYLKLDHFIITLKVHVHVMFHTIQLISVGIENLDWMSPNFPDFVAKTRASICVELQSLLLTVRQHTQAIESTAESWTKASGMDLFSREGGNTKLMALEQRHRLVYYCNCSAPDVIKFV